MKTHDLAVTSGTLQITDTDSMSRLAALERLIAYARQEAEQLKADILVFCLDASLSVARTELEDQKNEIRRVQSTIATTSRH